MLLPDLGSQIVPSDITASINTTIVNLRYVPSPNLLVTARLRDLDLDRGSPMIVYRDELQNQSISRGDREGVLDATYTGIRSTMLRASYTTRKVEREVRQVHEEVGTHPDPVQEEWEHPVVADRTDWKTLRVGITSYLVPSVTLRANWKTSDIDHPSYHGTPSDVDDLTAGLTYTPREDMVFYADWRRLSEDNNEIPPPGFLTIADLADPTEYTERREAQSGAQFSNDTDSLILGLYKSFGSRVTCDLNYMVDEIDSRAYWIVGIDANYPPHIGGEGDTTGLPPELVPYNAKNKIWQAGLTYALNRRLTLRGNFLSGRTDGRTTTDSLFRLVAPVDPKTRDWQPINVDYRRAAVGLAYRWSSRQQVLLELSHNVWEDAIDPSFDGEYTSATLALATQF